MLKKANLSKCRFADDPDGCGDCINKLYCWSEKYAIVQT